MLIPVNLTSYQITLCRVALLGRMTRFQRICKMDTEWGIPDLWFNMNYFAMRDLVIQLGNERDKANAT